MPNGNLSELVKQELEKRGGDYSDLEAGLMARNGPQKSPRKGKKEFFEPADGKGPLRNPMVRTCCSFCMSPALRWMVIIVSLVVAGYAYGVAVENGWTDAGSKHVQAVAQKTGDFVNRVRGTVPAVDASKEETPQESKSDETSQEVADHESQTQDLVSAEQSSTDKVDKVDELNEDTPQEQASEKSNEEVDQDVSSEPSEQKIVHHEPVEGLQKLVDVKLEESKEKEPSSVELKATKTETAEASSAPKVTDPVTKEEESSKKLEEESGEESKKTDLATSEHSSSGDEATEEGKAGTEEEPETPVAKGSKVVKPKGTTKDDEEEKTGATKPNADSTSSVKVGEESTAGNVAARATESSSTDKVVAGKEEAGSKKEPETPAAKGSKVHKAKETTVAHEEEETGTAAPNADSTSSVKVGGQSTAGNVAARASESSSTDKVVAENEEGGSKEEPELPLPSGSKKPKTKEAIKDLDEEKPDTTSSAGAAVESDAENVDDKKSATHLPDNVMDTRRPGVSLG